MEFLVTGILAPIVFIGALLLFGAIHPALGLIMGIVIALAFVEMRASGKL